MELNYSDAATQKVCTERREAVRRFGTAGAGRLQRRVGELRSATTPGELFEGPGRWHPLKGDRVGTFAADVTGTVRIIVSFSGAPPIVLVEAVGNEYH